MQYKINQNTLIFTTVLAAAVGVVVVWATSKSTQDLVEEFISRYKLNETGNNGLVYIDNQNPRECTFVIKKEGGQYILEYSIGGDKIKLENLSVKDYCIKGFYSENLSAEVCYYMQIPDDGGFLRQFHDGEIVIGENGYRTNKSQQKKGGKKCHRRSSHRKSLNRRR